MLGAVGKVAHAAQAAVQREEPQLTKLALETGSAGTASDQVIIVGAGQTGMSTAIELAQRGVRSIVLEARGEPTRVPVFLVLPDFLDKLHGLDSTGTIIEKLNPIHEMRNTIVASNSTTSRTFEAGLTLGTPRSRGDATHLVNTLIGTADDRTRATIGINTLDAALRDIAERDFSDLIEIRLNSKVDGVQQGDGWAEAILAPSGDGAASEAVRGALLINASARSTPGTPFTTFPEQGFFIGSRFDAREGAALSTLTRTVTEHVGADGETRSLMSVALPTSDRTMVWSQIDRPPSELTPDEARSVIASRAPLVGVNDELAKDAATFPVTVQLGMAEESASGRIYNIGDARRNPYFMTSSGAAIGVVHDAPMAADAAISVMNGSATVDGAAAKFNASARAADELLLSRVRPKLRRDLGLPSSGGEPGTTAPR